MKRRWWRWPALVATVIVIGCIGTVVDYALIPPHSWTASMGKGVAGMAGVIVGAAVLCGILRHRR